MTFLRDLLDMHGRAVRKIEKALVKCDDGVRSSIAWWETPDDGELNINPPTPC